MDKTLIIFFYLAITLSSSKAVGQNDINKACEHFAKVAFENTFDLYSIERSKALLLKSLQSIEKQKFNSCNCNDSIWQLNMRDNRRFGPKKSTHTPYPEGVLDTNKYLTTLTKEIDYQFLQKEFSFETLERPLDSIQYVLNKLRGMILEPNEKGVRYYYGCILGESLVIRDHREQLVEEYFSIIKDDSVEKYLKDFLLVNKFSPKIKHPKMDSLIADIFHPEHPLFFRICGLLRIYGGPQSTAKIMRTFSAMDSIQREFTISLPISYYRRNLISRKEVREYGKFVFENQLYPWCKKGWWQYLGEKNEKAFKRRYRRYLK